MPEDETFEEPQPQPDNEVSHRTMLQRYLGGRGFQAGGGFLSHEEFLKTEAMSLPDLKATICAMEEDNRKRQRANQGKNGVGAKAASQAAGFGGCRVKLSIS